MCKLFIDCILCAEALLAHSRFQYYYYRNVSSCENVRNLIFMARLNSRWKCKNVKAEFSDGNSNNLRVDMTLTECKTIISNQNCLSFETDCDGVIRRLRQEIFGKILAYQPNFLNKLKTKVSIIMWHNQRMSHYSLRMRIKFPCFIDISQISLMPL